MTQRLSIIDLLTISGLLLLAFGLRAHLVEAVPPFNDESLHIGRAENVFTDRDTALTPYKTLVYFWVGAFQPERPESVFVGRTVVSLFALLGLAGTYALGRLLFGRWAATLALTLAVFSPFMIFFDRLLLSDPMTSALAVLMLWLSIVLARRGASCGRYCPLAMGVGVLGFLLVMAKTIGLPLLAMPAIAVLLYGQGTHPVNFSFGTLRNWTLQRLLAYRDRLLTVYVTFSLCFIPSIVHLIERTVTGQYVTIVNNNLVLGLAEDRSPPEVVLDNMEKVWNVNWTLHGPVLWLAIIVGMSVLLRIRPRAGLYLLVGILLAWSMSVLLGAELSTRYMLPGTLPSLVVLSGAVHVTIQALRNRQPIRRLPLRSVVFGSVGLWVVVFAVPFIDNAWHEPTALELPARDEWEYFTNFSAGYGLVDAADDFYELERAEPSGRVNVIGLVGSCHQIRLYVPNARTEDDGPIWLTCPAFGWSGENLMIVAEDIQQRLATQSAVYLLIEPEIPFFDPEDLRPYWNWREVERYQRPNGGMEIVLYHITPLAEDTQDVEMTTENHEPDRNT